MALGSLTTEMESALGDITAAMGKLIDAEVEGLWPGTHDLRGDAQFQAWFMTMLRDYGPDWVAALEFVDDGPEVLKRWNRIVATTMGVTDG